MTPFATPTVKTSSKKRFLVVVDGVRVASSDTRGRGLSQWRREVRRRPGVTVFLVDAHDGAVVRPLVREAGV